jgi:hypothetical protein
MDTVYPGVDNIPLCDNRIAVGASKYHTNPLPSQVTFSFAVLAGALLLNMPGFGGIHRSPDLGFPPPAPLHPCADGDNHAYYGQPSATLHAHLPSSDFDDIPPAQRFSSTWLLSWLYAPEVLNRSRSINQRGMTMKALKVGRRRRNKPFTTVAVVFFALIAFVHLLRLLLGWEVTVNDMVVPKWASGPGLVITAGLALMLWREARK